MVCFGPVPSRRLGKSLGINNLAGPKVCTYSCRYCQLGITNNYRFARHTYYPSDFIVQQVDGYLDKLSMDNRPDFLTFVANGEPTLDINLGKTIEQLKGFKIPIAVITNASLLFNPYVRNDLMGADWVSVKVDAIDPKIWEAINWPVSTINFNDLTEGLLLFATMFKGKLMTETMLVKNVNDQPDMLQKTAHFIAQLNPHTAYLSIPIRPTAVKTVKIPDPENVNQAFQLFSKAGLHSELLLGIDDTSIGHTGNITADILNTCSVHPIRKDMMQELLMKNNADQNVIDRMVSNKLIKKVNYNSNVFYILEFQEYTKI
jgi:wyosine [tRNA(Phe)-imidazoG37] synthetase (radical SAM superfamily)